MISNMQYPREMYGRGGLTSLREARNLLEKYALPGESLAYINDEEARFLKYMGGAGIPVNSSGIPSYFKKFFKKVTKPVAKILDKIVPNSLKPFLPFIAAAVPFIGPALAPGIMGALTAGQMAAVAAGANAISQLSQEGAAERGLNPVSLGLSALSGYSAGAGMQPAGAASAGKIVGNVPASTINPELAQFGNLATESVGLTGSQLASLPLPEISGGANSLLEAYGGTAPTLGQQIQNLGASTTEFLGKATRPGMDSIGEIFNDPFAAAGADYLKAGTLLAPPLATAAAEQIYLDAQRALEDYNKQRQAMGDLGIANTEARRSAVRRAMSLAGYTEQEITGVLPRLGLMGGGYLGYAGGGQTRPTMPMNPDMLAIALYGLRYDQLTYTQKSAIDDMLATKKAEGGIMDLGGKEMDLRAKGGFVPIGKKEKADDVPARLSKNEFVFTAKAVRGAGKGDVSKGAKRMYDLMRQYEAMA